jgi:hypothetical protein
MKTLDYIKYPAFVIEKMCEDNTDIDGSLDIKYYGSEIVQINIILLYRNKEDGSVYKSEVIYRTKDEIWHFSRLTFGAEDVVDYSNKSFIEVVGKLLDGKEVHGEIVTGLLDLLFRELGELDWS